MASLQLFSDKGNSTLSLVNNLKVTVAAKAADGNLKVNSEDDSNLKLLNKATGFELTEPNAIVKYLINDFDSASILSIEETAVYSAHKSGKKEEVISFIKSESSPFTKAELTASQIILFSSVYPYLKDVPEGSGLANWANEFSKIGGVSESIQLASSITKVERPKAVNTGAQKVKPGFVVKSNDESILPKEGERNIIITSALPYVNNVPHLGNIIGSVLSADIYARYTKARNYNSLFICGTDEYGTATETKALEEKMTPRELCDKFSALHAEIYKWFGIGFDYFGRTTTDLQTEIAQDIFMKLFDNGFLEEKTTKQLYCETHKSFLADRYVEGTCPKCKYDDARGDQCDKCGTLLDPFELINPHCKLDNATPIPRDSTHIYLKLNDLEPELKVWVEEASEKGAWSKNTRNITQNWLKQGLEPRCITRDLVWGTPVPLEKFKEKVLYVWFDATIGYVSITANYFKSKNSTEDWKKWWRNPEHVNLYQFMGKDNVPFHTVVFPASLIGTREEWTKVHHVSTTEYLQYEGGKFSKSRGVGVFGNNAKDTGIPASVWRYYLASIRPESGDSQFSWTDFVTKNNSELLANVGNYVNRIVKFVSTKYNGVIADFDTKNVENFKEFEKDINELLASYVESMEAVSLRRGLELAMAISARGNQFLQDNKLDNSLYENSPDKSDAVIGIGLNLAYLIGSLLSPFIPDTTTQINEILNAPTLTIPDKFEIVLSGGHCIGKPQYLFKRIDEKKIEEWRALYGGKQVA
ncbi:methionine--tRNA ligase mes1 [Yamadazyma tenuis]|uniref:methionine--tRNA ligase n=1 Tax=Candida tenuis (strain ATCC 10573 / BCRC 21748 / CBS 615 / JCM 9827 / NBRC 10315 / NRRL Y-1498 / VKM Y-70) TaxID=590646 RepID=G3B4G5_CANTC|nr:methionyl-tRNA synthetase [Yamadazyma tenuis ATCC 10573]EGV63822.1 methionyl-tRNA synthetase [Yamadazyma tenuis ATCC 10573]WEJ96570.1 methionine--tRNA ligase mes1 [Yamadazyma tenuis]